MASRQLDNLLRAGTLKAEQPSKAEFDGLVRSGTVRLKDARNKALDPESRFDLAYNAAHALSVAALRWHGYRSDKRYLVFQCLEHTLGLPPEQWRVLEQAHRMRNIAEYEGAAEISSELFEALLRVTQEIQVRASKLAPISDEKR